MTIRSPYEKGDHWSFHSWSDDAIIGRLLTINYPNLVKQLAGASGTFALPQMV